MKLQGSPGLRMIAAFGFQGTIDSGLALLILTGNLSAVLLKQDLDVPGQGPNVFLILTVDSGGSRGLSVAGSHHQGCQYMFPVDGVGYCVLKGYRGVTERLLVSFADNNRTEPVNGHALDDRFWGRFLHGDFGRFLLLAHAAKSLPAWSFRLAQVRCTSLFITFRFPHDPIKTSGKTKFSL